LLGYIRVEMLSCYPFRLDLAAASGLLTGGDPPMPRPPWKDLSAVISTSASLIDSLPRRRLTERDPVPATRSEKGGQYEKQRWGIVSLHSEKDAPEPTIVQDHVVVAADPCQGRCSRPV